MLKIGKISENVLKRSVLKLIKNKRDEIILGAGVGIDSSIISPKESEVIVTSVDPITATTCNIGYLAVHCAVNDIAASMAEPVSVMISALLPPGSEEEEIRSIVRDAEAACKELNIQLMGGHTQITDAVTRTVLTTTAYGIAKADRYKEKNKPNVGDDIVITKWIGLEGTSIIANEKESELKERFSLGFVDTAKKFDEMISIVLEARIAEKMGATYMHDITEGGVFGALWELSVVANTGLKVYINDIPIRQESIEICEVFGLNIYELISGGSLIITVPNGKALCRELKEQGINACVVGSITEGNDKVIINDDEIRYLEMPKPDQIYFL